MGRMVQDIFISNETLNDLIYSWKKERDLDYDFCNMLLVEFQDYVVELKTYTFSVH